MARAAPETGSEGAGKAKWPNVECKGKTALYLLTGIVKLADVALSEKTLDAALHTAILSKVARCATNQPETKRNENKHCEALKAAFDKAADSKWLDCLKQLRHGHGLGTELRERGQQAPSAGRPAPH